MRTPIVKKFLEKSREESNQTSQKLVEAYNKFFKRRNEIESGKRPGMSYLLNLADETVPTDLGVEPEKLAEAIVAALTVRYPSKRIAVGGSEILQATIATRLLPTFLLDAILRRRD